MFNQYDCRTRDDGYTKTAPYPFLIRSFLSEKVMMFDQKRMARILRFLPLMKCRWRLKYYTEQYSWCRRVFDGKKNELIRNNDVAGNSRSRGILCEKKRESFTPNALEVPHKRVQVAEAILWKKGRRRDSHAVHNKRKTTLPKSVPVDSRDIWQTEAIQQLLGYAQKRRCDG